MSNAYITWAWQVSSLKPSDRLVLVRIADLADDHGCWQIVIGDLARAASMSHSTARRALDRIALEGLLMFKAEAYRNGKAQAAHRFQLTRTPEERVRASAQGFVADRRTLDRGVNDDKFSPQSWKEGGSKGERRVGPLLDHIQPLKTPLKIPPP